MGTSLYDKHLPSHKDIRFLVERYFINSDDYSSDPNNEEGKPIWTVAIMDAIADGANVAAMSKIMAGLTKDGAPDDPLSAYLELSRGTYDIEFAEEAVREVMGREDTKEYILSKQPYLAPVPNHAIRCAVMEFVTGPFKGYEPFFMCRGTNDRAVSYRYLVAGRAFGSDEFHIWLCNIHRDLDDHNRLTDVDTCPESSLYAELHNFFRDVTNEPNRNSTNFHATDVLIENEYHRLVEKWGAKIDGIEKTGHFGNLERYFEEYGLGDEDRVRIRRKLADHNAVRAMVLDGRLYWQSGDGREYAATADELHLPCGYFAGESEEAQPWPEWEGDKKGEMRDMENEGISTRPIPAEAASGPQPARQHRGR